MRGTNSINGQTQMEDCPRCSAECSVVHLKWANNALLVTREADFRRSIKIVDVERLAIRSKRVRLDAEDVAALVGADGDEVIFTSGATEANNLALFGLVDVAAECGR